MALAGLALLGAGVSEGCGGTAARTRADLSAASGAQAGAQPTSPARTAAPRPRAPAASSDAGAASASGSIAGPPRPAIIQSPIPFGARRKSEMRAYARRHYGIDSYRLLDPHVIVIHYTDTSDFASTFNVFAPDVPDSELHELPGTCAHFVIDRHGEIHQLVPLGIMCRHTVGLNWTAIGIEHVGFSDAEVLGDGRQMTASLALVRWLQCRLRIRTADVIGHNESLSSRYHHENVAALRTQTHSDFNHADMQVYRRRLRAAGAC